jgi:hypothetical protein
MKQTEKSREYLPPNGVPNILRESLFTATEFEKFLKRLEVLNQHMIFSEEKIVAYPLDPSIDFRGRINLFWESSSDLEEKEEGGEFIFEESSGRTTEKLYAVYDDQDSFWDDHEPYFMKSMIFMFNLLLSF